MKSGYIHSFYDDKTIYNSNKMRPAYKVEIQDKTYQVFERTISYIYFSDNHDILLEFIVPLSVGENVKDLDFIRSECKKHLSIFGYYRYYGVPEQITIFDDFQDYNASPEWKDEPDPVFEKHNCNLKKIWMMDRKWLHKLYNRIRGRGDPPEKLIEHLQNHSTYYYFQLKLNVKRKAF